MYIFILFLLSITSLYSAPVMVPDVVYRDGVYCVTLDETTPYRRGCQHGAALRVPIKKTMQKFVEWLEPKLNGMGPEDVMDDFLKNSPYLEYIQRYVPDLLDELLGIACGAQVSFSTLFSYQNFEEFSLCVQDFPRNFRDGTTIALYKREDLPHFLGQNFDLPEFHEGNVLALRILYPNGHEIIQHGFIGQIGTSGINAKGIAVTALSMGTPWPFNGVPLPMVARKLLEESDMESLEKYLHSIPTTASHYTVLDKDRILSIDAWEFDRLKHPTYTNSAFYTSHLQKEATLLSGLLLAGEEETANFNLFKELFQLCPIMRTASQNKTMGTMLAVVSKEGTPLLYIAGGAPLGMPYVPFQFAKKSTF